MDRNGKKPKATHGAAPHPERSDTKAHSHDQILKIDAGGRATEKAKTDERQTRTNRGQKGPQHLE